MINTKFFIKTLSELAKERNVEEATIIEILKEAFVKAFHKNFDPEAELDIKIDVNSGEIEIINNSKTVVEDKNPEEDNPQEIKLVSDDAMRAIEIPLADAKRINPDVVVGDVISAPVNIKSFTITAANHIKQMIIQKMRELERENTYKKWMKFEGKIQKAIIERKTSRGDYILMLKDGKTIAHMKPENVNPLEKYYNGQKILILIESVSSEATGPQIIASRTSPELIKLALQEQVPEVYDKTVEIVNIVRKAGLRTKIAVRSNNHNVDPVGSIIGERGKRIIAISNMFSGEPIDVVRFSEDPIQYLASSLSPAKVVGIKFETVPSNGATVVVGDKNYLVAIGKRGSNASMAAKLTGKNITIVRLSEAEEKGIKYQEVNLDNYKKPSAVKLEVYQPGVDFKQEVANAVDLEEFSQDQIENKMHGKDPVVVETKQPEIIEEVAEEVKVVATKVEPTPTPEVDNAVVEVATAKTIDNIEEKTQKTTTKPKFPPRPSFKKAHEVEEEDGLSKAEKTAEIVNNIDTEANENAIKEIEKHLDEDNFSADDYDEYYDDEDY